MAQNGEIGQIVCDDPGIEMIAAKPAFKIICELSVPAMGILKFAQGFSAGFCFLMASLSRCASAISSGSAAALFADRPSASRVCLCLVPGSASRSFDDAVPGAAVAVHTFGDFQQFNPHLHQIATDGCFSGAGTFTKSREPVAKDLEGLFQYEVLKMLKADGKINDAVIENMLSWRHK
jgi:hypothetical protein